MSRAATDVGEKLPRTPTGRRLVLAVTAAAAACVLLAATSASTDFGPHPPSTPALGPAGSATMHGDAASSDTSPYAGPGAGPVDSRFTELGAACPTILAGSDGYPQALCTTVLGRTPTVHLLDPETGTSVASLRLAKGSLLGGVYAYLDENDRMVAVDGNGDLVRIAHDHHVSAGSPRLYVASRTPIQHAVADHCGGGDCDSVNSLLPDSHGKVWFATQHGAVGYVDPDSGTARSRMLGDGEHVANSISTVPQGTAVATDHALYLLTTRDDAAPRIRWRKSYDRGPARKPGQLSHGTGATPTFFGPTDGTEYVTITDNATPRENLLVYDTDTGRRICSVPASRGTEVAPVASGNSVFVAGTYGYPYPATPDDAGPSDPRSAPFTGGMARIDVRPDASGCEPVWRNDVRSAAVPRLSTKNGILYTIARKSPLGHGEHTSPLEHYSYTAVDGRTGDIRTQQQIGVGFPADTLQMVGSITADDVLYQGTVTGLFRITAG